MRRSQGPRPMTPACSITERQRPHAFVIGTGRCGSTVISDILNKHPDVLSISEFFSALYPFSFEVRTPVSVGSYVEYLTAPQVRARLLLHYRAEPTEYLYPVDNGLRYNRASGVAPVSLTALPHLSGSPDDTLDELVGRLSALPRVASIGRWFLDTFEALAGMFSKGLWVERSGTSLLYVEQLVRMFPDAKFVHLHRNGVDCALSMAQHSTFRLAHFEYMALARLSGAAMGTLGQIPFHEWRSVDEFAAFLHAGLGRKVDRHLLVDGHVEVEWFGLLWSLVVARGLRFLGSLGHSRVLHVSYESLVTAPDAVVASICRFLGVPADPAFIEDAASTVIKPRGRLWPKSVDIERVVRACSLGQRLIDSTLSP